MKKILLAIILSMLIASSSSASEIFGQISTNPNALPVKPDNSVTDKPSAGQSPSATPAPVIKNNQEAAVPLKPDERNDQSEKTQSVALKPEVLGIKIYPDGSLLRGADRKIYFIQGRIKKHIASLTELNQSRGRAILEATAEELSGYQTREYLDGKLIRQRGDAKVYVIKQGLKQHILNLEELRANYFGREIFNISREEMALY